MNAPNRDGDSALWQAASHGQEAVVRFLLAVPGVEVDAGAEHAPLLSAVYLGYGAIVRHLIDAGADVNKVGGMFVENVQHILLNCPFFLFYQMLSDFRCQHKMGII